MKVTVGSVDAIVFLDDRTILVEAMVRDEPGKIAELEMYRDLFLSDPEYKARWELPVELVLLTPIFNPFIRAKAEERGIRYVYYRPPWIEQYLESLPPRMSAGRLHGVKAGK